MKEKNLIPITDRSPEERKEIASKGGKAKAEKARTIRTLRDTMADVLTRDFNKWEFGYSDGVAINESDDSLTRVCASLVNQAVAGDMKAMSLLFALYDKMSEAEPKQTE